MEDMPDLSHLNDTERRIIEEVMMRQKREEDRETEIMRRKQSEVNDLELMIRQRSEQQKKAGVELDATCHICLKTKFADGVGHVCNYCHIRCCARCGGKVTLRSNKVIWVCILCRKKQELLSKTGQWMNKGFSGVQDVVMSRIQADIGQQQFPALSDQSPLPVADKRPKLERAHSAAEKENVSLQRSNSQLRRQYSQQEPINSGYQHQDMPDDPGYYRAELDDLMRSAPYYPPEPTYDIRTQPPAPQTPSSGKRHKRPGSVKKHGSNGRYQTPPQQQRSFSSSEDDLRSTSAEMEMDVDRGSEKVTGGNSEPIHLVQQYHRNNHERQVVDRHKMAPNRHSTEDIHYTMLPNRHSTENVHYDDETWEVGTPFERRHSFTSDSWDSRGMSAGERVRQSWFDSIRDRYQTINRGVRRETPFPKTMDNYLSKYSDIKNTIIRSGSKFWEDSDKRTITERRKKTVRFDGGPGGREAPTSTISQHSDDDGWMTLSNAERWDSARQTSSDSGTKDSGIETSSNFTSEDSTRGDFKHLLNNWQRKGDLLIAHMILNRTRDLPESRAMLGVQVVGDVQLEYGVRGAIIEKVKKGSVADLDGQLKPGDEVIEWNGKVLRGASAHEVEEVIARSKRDPQVELVVARPFGTGPPRQWSIPYKDAYDMRMEKPCVRVTSPGSPDIHSSRPSINRHTLGSNANVGGKLQIKLWFDAVELQLVVTLVCAAGLTPRPNGEPRNPYAKLFLLPDKSEKSKRRTKTIASTNEPRWSQSFVYTGVRRADLKSRTLEVTLWDYVHIGANDFLGEVILEIKSASLDDQPSWYYLMPHHQLPSVYGRRGEYEMDLDVTPTDHLSPPSTTSRLSDSDTSDLDDLVRDRRLADGASISSLGSSASPPPDVEMTERRSRRDMSPPRAKTTHIGLSRDSQIPYQPPRKNGGNGQSHRSHSAAPSDPRSRSKSPRRMGSLSPPESRILPSQAYVPRMTSRSATATPTGSPKKRQLPQIPPLQHGRGFRESQDFSDDRMRYIKQRYSSVQRRHGSAGWERRYGVGLSDGDLTSETKQRMRDWLSPDKEFGDSDMESIVSSTFSTQSERPVGVSSADPSSSACEDPKQARLPAPSPMPKPLNACVRLRRSKSGRNWEESSWPSFVDPIEVDKEKMYLEQRIKYLEEILKNGKLWIGKDLQDLATMVRDSPDGLDDELVAKVKKEEGEKNIEVTKRDSMMSESSELPIDCSGLECCCCLRDGICSLQDLNCPDCCLTPACCKDNSLQTQNLPHAATEKSANYLKPPKELRGSKTLPPSAAEIPDSRNVSPKLTRSITSLSNAPSPAKFSQIYSEFIASDQFYEDGRKTVTPNCGNSPPPVIAPDFNEVGEFNHERVSSRSPSSGKVAIDEVIMSSNNRLAVESCNLLTTSEHEGDMPDFYHQPKMSSPGKMSPDKRSLSSNNRLAMESCNLRTTSEHKGDIPDFYHQPKMGSSGKSSPDKGSLSSEHRYSQSGVISKPNERGNTESPQVTRRSLSPSVTTPEKYLSSNHKDSEEILMSTFGKETPGSHSPLICPKLDKSSNRTLSPIAKNLSTDTRSVSPASRSSTPPYIFAKMSGARMWQSENVELRSPTPDSSANSPPLLASSEFSHSEQGTTRIVRENLGSRGGSRRGQFARSLSSNADQPPDEKGDGSLSDTGVGPLRGLELRDHRKPASERGVKICTSPLSSMGKKSSSTSQLSATGRKRRMGFGKAGKTSFTVHRSEEILPDDTRRVGKMGSSVSSDGEGSQDGESWAYHYPEGGQLTEFIDGLGPGQLVGRQVLGLPSLGEIQLQLTFGKDYLEVEVIRARGLQQRPGTKVLPTSYVKVYLVNGKNLIAKAKSEQARRTLDPIYKGATFRFTQNTAGCVLQVTVWGVYGRFESKKCFMGATQIMLDDLDRRQRVLCYYKLFGTTALVSGRPSGGLSRRSSLASLDSLKL